MEPSKITIIGGGFCGIMTAINLVNEAMHPMHISIINKCYPLAKGVAYSPHTSSLLLNVPNGRMSAFADIPDHFVKWLKAAPEFSCQPDDELAAAFSTRERYGNYLAHLWREALEQKKSNISITVYDDDACNMLEDDGRYYIFLKNHPVLTADFVVLATGNVQPRLPSGIPASFSASKHYFGNPWKMDCIENLDQTGDILIIGNGLTMADTVVGLAENGFANNIYTVSPHGHNLNPWEDTKPSYTGLDIHEILNGNIELRSLVKNLNKHRKMAVSLDQSAYSLVDSLRQHAQKIWQVFSLEEKQQFLKYLRHLWGSVRHRLPAKMYGFMADLYTQKRLFTYKGTVSAVTERNGLVNVSLNCEGVLKHLAVQRIINCTGPEGNLKLSANELLRNLEKNGLICPDALNMGINASPEDGMAISSDGNCRPGLFVIGTNLKGILWESTAVPELRVQAKKLAARLIEKCHGRIFSPHDI